MLLFFTLNTYFLYFLHIITRLFEYLIYLSQYQVNGLLYLTCMNICFTSIIKWWSRCEDKEFLKSYFTFTNLNAHSKFISLLYYPVTFRWLNAYISNYFEISNYQRSLATMTLKYAPKTILSIQQWHSSPIRINLPKVVGVLIIIRI